MRSLALVGLMAVCLPACGDTQEKTCTLLGCSNMQATVTATTPLSEASLANAKVTVCRVGHCYTSDPLSGTAGESWTGAMKVVVSHSGSGSSIAVTLPAIDRSAVPETETFSMDVSDASGSVLFHASKAVPGRTYPNGKECDGDYYCAVQQVTL